MTEMARRTETTYGGELELSASVPIPHRPIVARVAARFERRAARVWVTIADGAGVTAEDVLRRLKSEEGAHADLLEQTLRGIERKAAAEHRRAMAAVAANAWSGDDATVDRAAWSPHPS